MDGTELCWSAPAHHDFWWSHGTTARAGIAIGMKKSFRQRFHHITWQELHPGKAGMLTLSGPEGQLVITAAYFHTGLPDSSHSANMPSSSGGRPNDRPEDDRNPKDLRHNMRELIASKIPSSESALTIVTGDATGSTSPRAWPPA